MTNPSTQAEQRDREVARTAGRKMASPFTAKVVGVSFVPGYPDNLHRLSAASDEAQALGEPLAAVLVRNPKNEYDPNAIEVHVPALGPHGGFIGHLTRPIVARMAPEIDAGAIWHAEVGDVLIDPDHMDRPGISIRCKRREEAAEPPTRTCSGHSYYDKQPCYDCDMDAEAEGR